jgi:UDP-N-acetylglucosamine 2-epimerase (non-hydrolysing)
MGTRPEAIKMAPVVLELRRRSGEFDPLVVATAQHRSMLDQVLSLFDIVPDVDLDLMRPGQGLADLTARLTTTLHDLWLRMRPDMVLVQGDTTSSFVGSLTAYYAHIPIGHIEAGLRTYDKYGPFPEEMNRRLIDPLADLCFAPTQAARENLIEERVPDARIHVTGNTGIDALLFTVEHNRSSCYTPSGIGAEVFGGGQLVLVTGHRRESFGVGFVDICNALLELADARPNVSIVYPVHPNPNVWEPVTERLGSVANIHLIAPLDYQAFVYLMDRCDLIITDSGGIQEEAPSFNKPVLVMRATTERHEAIDAGVAELVGTDSARIVRRALGLLDAPSPIGRLENPFGDGRAAPRIVQILAEQLRIVGSSSQRTSDDAASTFPVQ